MMCQGGRLVDWQFKKEKIRNHGTWLKLSNNKEHECRMMLVSQWLDILKS